MLFPMNIFDETEGKGYFENINNRVMPKEADKGRWQVVKYLKSCQFQVKAIYYNDSSRVDIPINTNYHILLLLFEADK